MSNCYKNFPVIINYSDNTSETIFSNSVSLSENLNIEHASSLGIPGSNTVYSQQLPRGEITVDSYLVDGLSIINKLQGSSDQEVSIQFGPYSCPTPCVLSSISVSISLGEPITVRRSFNYFGTISVGSSPTPQTPSLVPVVPDNLTLNGFEGLGSFSNPQSISWSFNQSYEEYYLITSTKPIIVFSQGQIKMDVNGEGMAKELVVQNCIANKQEYSISIKDCEQTALGSLSIDGYLQNRESSVSTESDEQNSVSIIQYL